MPSNAETGPGASARSRPPIALFVVAIFASAFLIFLVQPMLGKRILPWFGGVPAVWTLCLAFFQTTLFLGYAYAHLMVRFATGRVQLVVHTLAIGAALFSLPVLPRYAAGSLGDAEPAVQILSILTAKVALPFLVLASTGPLVQAWFARAHPGRSPYPLYAVSNLGSLLALFSYPFLLEPSLSLTDTGTLWSFGFVFAAVAVLGCVAPMARAVAAQTEPIVASDHGSSEDLPGRKVALWLLLPGCAVVLLMAITNTLCLDVASVPFLWVLPLATYLVTFILCFSTVPVYRRTPYVVIALAAFVLADRTRFWPDWVSEVLVRPSFPFTAQIAIHVALLFSTCMILHGELYRLRPAPRSLTVFYLCVSAGGAIGGILVGIVAPLIFAGYYELNAGLALYSVLVLATCANDPRSVMRANGPRWRWAVVAPIALAALAYGAWRTAQPLPLLVHQERSFFGVLRVFESQGPTNRHRRLVNGTTMHGVQFTDENFRRLPTSYYGQATGLGLALSEQTTGASLRIGVVGLGVGTLAAYGDEDDMFRFYEIDPAVVRIAGKDGFFSYLEGTPARVEVVVGDARLSIAEEQARGETQDFDFLIVDAFTSDSIPVHLLTREAFAHYVDALAEDGVLALHVTNQYFGLTGLVARMGFEAGVSNLAVATSLSPQLQSQPALWVLLARDPERLLALKTSILKRHHTLRLASGSIQMSSHSEEQLGDIPVWTDDYSDLFSLLLSK